MSLPLTGYAGALGGPQSSRHNPNEAFSWGLLFLVAASQLEVESAARSSRDDDKRTPNDDDH